MEGKASLRIMVAMLLIGMSTSAFNGHLAFAYSSQFYITVPHYYQVTSIFCGPASLEMVFDFYGPDVSQYEIANVARVWWDFGGTADLEDMRRAAHFSNLSSSTGPWIPGNYVGYSPRDLGYAAFTASEMTLEQLRDIISNGYPLIVTTWYIDHSYGHYRVIVGYNETHVTFHDPWYGLPYRGPNVSVTNSEFLVMWECACNWGLFVSPWEVAISAPEKIKENNVFTVTAAVTYPCPDPFSSEEYPASLCNASIVLPEGLSLAPGETAKKILGAGELYPRNSATVSWLVHADSPGDFTFSVEAEGKVAGSVPQVGGYPAYDYEDRIGGSASSNIRVTPRVITTSVDVDPDTLNLRSRGEWITAYVELPEGYDASQIDVPSIRLNETISVDLNAPTEIIDHDNDGTPGLMVKFNRSEVSSFIIGNLDAAEWGFENVTLTITGELPDGPSFIGNYIIRTVKGDVNGDGAVDIIDLSMVSIAYGTFSGESRYSLEADINKDSVIDTYDLTLVTIAYGTICP